MSEPLTWPEFADAARACGWVAYLGTADTSGRPHVSVVSPGFDADGILWFGTRPQSAKARNLRQRPDVTLHWPVGSSEAPGECFARGSASLHESIEERRVIWDSGVMPYDLSQFFGSPDNDDHLFVEVRVALATIVGPDFLRRRWRR